MQNDIGDNINGLASIVAVGDMGVEWNPLLTEGEDGYREKVSRTMERSGGMWFPAAANKQ
jgi:hypothetical protein